MLAGNGKWRLARFHVITGPILDIRDIGAFLKHFFSKKGHFACSHSLNRCHF